MKGVFMYVSKNVLLLFLVVTIKRKSTRDKKKEQCFNRFNIHIKFKKNLLERRIRI